MNKRKINIGEEILSGRARVIDLTRFRMKDYTKCKGTYAEVIEGRVRVAFVRCPACKKYISVYRDELKSDGYTRNSKRCLCGFSKPLELVGWRKT